ncbi:MAG: type II toxin-antitoxin system VapC family toxin [Pyrinomonadaceae bacterium]|nr:type II toxin-antitoxin system VapC family toxin [Pyrinomonadaceae bacterium]
MNGNKSILDSNLIMFLSKGKIDLAKLRLKYSKFYVLIITYMEVYAYEFTVQAEKDLIDAFFGSVEIIEINREIADQAIIYRKNKSKKIKLPDAIILASAKYVSADLLTDDWDDFQNIDSTVTVEDIEDLKI